MPLTLPTRLSTPALPPRPPPARVPRHLRCVHGRGAPLRLEQQQRPPSLCARAGGCDGGALRQHVRLRCLRGPVRAQQQTRFASVLVQTVESGRLGDLRALPRRRLLALRRAARQVQRGHVRVSLRLVGRRVRGGRRLDRSVWHHRRLHRRRREPKLRRASPATCDRPRASLAGSPPRPQPAPRWLRLGGAFVLASPVGDALRVSTLRRTTASTQVWCCWWRSS